MSSGTMGATWMGHYPWFATYNTVEKLLPEDGYKGMAKVGCQAKMSGATSELKLKPKCQVQHLS